MKKIGWVFLLISLFVFNGTGLAWDFGDPYSVPSSSFSSSFSVTSSPYGGGFGGATSFGCSSCGTVTTTNSFSTTTTMDGYNGSISTAGASAYVEVIECEECDDEDGDGICDEDDNCPDWPNADQEDTDEDGVGDTCDSCFLTYNPGQEDQDGDGIGNVCDECPDDISNDLDQDGICAPDDNCHNDYNPGQEDTDGDGTGDACDACLDVDEDQVCDDVDNCLDISNSNQEDQDQDGVGDACDNCFQHFNDDQLDWDQNGIGDVCDPTGCDGYQLPECPDGSPTYPEADCTPQYPEVGICIDPCDPDGPGGQDPDVQCILDRECPCGAPPPPHGDYQSCIVHWAQELVDDGIIEPGIGTCYVSIAADSECGMPQWEDGVSEIPVYQEGECVPLDYSRCFTLEGTSTTGTFIGGPGTVLIYEICTDENRGGGYYGYPNNTFYNQGPTYGYYWVELISFPIVPPVDMTPDFNYGDHGDHDQEVLGTEIWVGVASDNVTISGSLLRPSDWVIGTPRQIVHRKDGGDSLSIQVTVTDITDY